MDQPDQRQWDPRATLVAAVLAALFVGVLLLVASWGMRSAGETPRLSAFETKPPPPLTDGQLQCLCGIEEPQRHSGH